MRRLVRSVLPLLRLTLSPFRYLRYLGPAMVIATTFGIIAYFTPALEWFKSLSAESCVLMGLIVFTLLLFIAAVRLQMKIDDYETPVLEIVYRRPPNGASSFYQGYSDTDQSGRTVTVAELFRVGVLNHGARTVQGVKVFLGEFSPQGSQSLPYPLRLMGDKSPFRSSLDGFSVDPGDVISRYVEVVSKDYVRPQYRNQIDIQHVQTGTPTMIPDNAYRFSLYAQGMDTPQSAIKVFAVSVNSDGRLGFAEVSSQ